MKQKLFYKQEILYKQHYLSSIYILGYCFNKFKNMVCCPKDSKSKQVPIHVTISRLNFYFVNSHLKIQVIEFITKIKLKEKLTELSILKTLFNF